MQTPAHFVSDRLFADVGRFRPIALIGRGGMGTVYRVFDAEMGRDVALKTLGNVDPDRLYRLKSEFRSLAGIIHPNLVELYELVASGRDCFFTMELVDGIDFLRHVRGEDAGPTLSTTPEDRAAWGDGEPLEEASGAADLSPDGLARMEAALPQLVRGLSELHAAGKVHRDVKPSNVLVTRAGRVVLLDFGLVIPYRENRGGAVEHELAGTLPYMAPEQMRDAAVSPAADWYSVGVLLYEALTGRLPFGGSPFQMVLDKEQLRARPPRELAASTPPALGALVMKLLRPDPAQRAGGEAILAALHPEARTPDGADQAAMPAGEGPFVGRAEELEVLRSAFEDVQRGQPAIVRIEGASGMGKTELVQRFLASIEGERGVVVLRGRCHPQESVPYKAFDPLVDALSSYLRGMHPIHLASVAPQGWEALTRLFPVLGRVPGFEPDPDLDDAVDPQDLRQRGFEKMRELLANLGQIRLLVLWIDDLQWGDLDSGQLLRELLRPAGTPPVLLLLSYRSEDVGRSPILGAVDAALQRLPAGVVRTIALRPLDEGRSRELLSALLSSRWSALAPFAAQLTAESAGSPFFLGELARYLRHALAGAVRDVRLSSVMQDRIEQLSPSERRLLAIASVEGRPLDQSLALQAAGLGEAGRPDAARLGRRSLLRYTELDGRPAIEPYHDRIREALVAQLLPDELRWTHRSLAEALRTRTSPDPEALLTHYLGAGDEAQAGHFAVLAAERAAASLAFDRAVELFRTALEIAGPGVERWALHRKLAEALTNAGRGGEAAESFMAAAAALAREAPDHLQIVTLERCAAEQYLHSGRTAEGMRVMGAVLARFGVRLPATARRALWSAVFGRVLLLARGFDIERSGPHQVSERALARLDALWVASTSLFMINFAMADALGVQHLGAALALGERSRAARALGLEATAEACVEWRPVRRRSARLLGAAEGLVRDTVDPYDRAWMLQCHGSCAWFNAAWAESVRLCDASAAIHRERGWGVSWDLALLDAFALSALAQLGRLRELSERLARSLRDAEQRGDLFAADNCRLGQPGIAWLAEGRTRECAELLSPDESELEWRLNPAQRYHHIISAVQTSLYLGDPWRAWAHIQAAWPWIKRSRLLWIAWIRVELRHLRARAALAAAAAYGRALPPGAAPPDARWGAARLVRLALAEARRIRRSPLPPAAPLAALIRAGAAQLAGDDEGAARALAQALDGFERADMALYREAARARLGALRGGVEGRALVEASRRWMAEEGVQDPAAMIAMLTPACGPA